MNREARGINREARIIKKIGLFGGTFNPVHLGHAILAERVYTDFKLDELIFIPSKLPPHKNVTGAAVRDRYEMVKLAAGALGDNFKVSDFEITSEGISYTHRTVKHWRENHPDDAIFFIAGTDIFISIGSWQNWEDLFNQCNFIVVNRTGTDFDEVLRTIPPIPLDRVVKSDEYKGEISGRIILYTMPAVDISSTEIRVQMDEKMLLDDIYNYIKERNLYKTSVKGE